MQYNFYIFIIGSFLFLCFAFHMIFTKTGNLYLNKLLAIMMLQSGLQMLYFIFVTTGQTSLVAFLFNFSEPMSFAYPACTYLYIRGFLKDERKLKKKDWFHFMPVLFSLINIIPWYMLDASTRAAVIKEIIVQNSFYIKWEFGIVASDVNLVLRSVLILVYLVFNWRKVIQPGIIKNRRNNPVGNKWILFLLGIMTLVSLNFLLTAVINVVKGSAHSDLFFYNYWAVLLSIVILALIGFVFYHPKVLYVYVFAFNEHADIEKGKYFVSVAPEEADKDVSYIEKDVSPLLPEHAPEPIETSKVKVTKKSIPASLPENEKRYLERIIDLMETEKLFLNPDFSINLLSQQTDIPVHHCSYIVNYVIGKNFRDWVNGYRIAYFIQQYPADSKSKTIRTISMESGFKIKATFYNSFLKEKGALPVKYFSE